MPRRLALACLVAAAPVVASAQSAPARVAAPAVSAVMGDDGKLVPGSAYSSEAERIGEGSGSQADATSPCPTSRPLDLGAAKALVRDIAERENFFPDFVVAVASVESRFNSIALSDKGAYGLMQLEPSTAVRFGVDRCDAAANVLGGVRYLRYLHDRYKNPMFILSAYNAGEARMLEAHGVPPFPETVKFVADVLNAFYDWPAPETTTVAATHRTDGHRPAPESALAAARHEAALAAARHEAGDAGWSQGFVKHIE